MLKLDDSSCSGRNYNERAVNNTTNERAGWLVQHVWICARVTKAILAVCRAGFAAVIAWES